MRPTVLSLMLASACALSSARGQTTGVPFVNDYTVTCVGCGTGSFPCWPPGTTGGTGGVSGSTSCTTLYFDISAGGTFTFTVTCAALAQVYIVIDPCPCTPCWAALPPVCGVPFTACGGTTSQSIDLDLSCLYSILFTGFASATGVYTSTITLPPFPPGACGRLSTQALIFGSPFVCAPPRFVSQAYDIILGA